MKGKRVLILMGTVALAAAFILLSCAPAPVSPTAPPVSPTAPPTEVEPIKIGVPVPLTGATPAIGEDQRNGILVWEAMHPEGILGRPIEFIFRDTQLKADVAVAKFKEFVEVEKVDFVVGSVSSSVTLALLPFAAQYKTLYFSCGAKSDQSTGVDFPKSEGYYFRLGSSNTVGAARAQAMQCKMVWPDAKSILHIGPSYSWGYDMWERQKEWYQENWPELELMEPVWHPMGERDFTPYITKIIGLDPDIVTTSTWGDDEAVFVRQAVPYGFFEKVNWCPVTYNVPELITVGETGPEGIWGAPCTYWFQSPDTAEKREIIAVWTEDMGFAPPGWCGQETYATMECLKAVCAEIGTIETEAVKEALEGFKFYNPMCGREVEIRAIDHQAMNPRFIGQISYSPEFGYTGYWDKTKWQWFEPEGLYYTDEELQAMWK